MPLIPYDRDAAVRYAHRWAFSRNPRFYNFDELGGDCTNFASQCLYAGAPFMNYTPDLGWYYIGPNNKAPAWTGPVGVSASIEELLPGDFVQLRFSRDEFGHTPVVVEVGFPATLENVLVAAHSQDSDFRPLSTYEFQEIRFIHILGSRK